MTTLFTPRLFVFGEAPIPKLGDFFGQENLECFDLKNLIDLDDLHADAIWKVSRNPYASFVYSDYMHLTIVNNYQKDKLTFLRLSGLKDRVFKIDSVSDAVKIEALREIIRCRDDLDFATDDLNSLMGGISDAAKEVFDDSICSGLEERIDRIIDQKQTFDYLLSQSLDEAISEFELLIQ